VLNEVVTEHMQDRLRTLLQERTIRRGTFSLASGRQSGYFFQGKLATLSPEGAFLTGRLVFERLRGRSIQAVGGKTLGADPIVAAVALVSETQREPIPGFIVRGTRKDHGVEDLIAEAYSDDDKPLISAGRHVAIVDDVATTGNSCMDAVRAVEEQGAIVDTILVLVDRKQGAAENFRGLGYQFEALFAADPDGTLRNWNAAEDA